MLHNEASHTYWHDYAKQMLHATQKKQTWLTSFSSKLLVSELLDIVEKEVETQAIDLLTLLEIKVAEYIRDRNLDEKAIAKSGTLARLFKFMEGERKKFIIGELQENAYIRNESTAFLKLPQDALIHISTFLNGASVKKYRHTSLLLFKSIPSTKANERYNFKGEPKITYTHIGYCYRNLILSADERWLVSISVNARSICIENRKTREQILFENRHLYKKSNGYYSSIIFSNNYLIASSTYGSIDIWDVRHIVAGRDSEPASPFISIRNTHQEDTTAQLFACPNGNILISSASTLKEFSIEHQKIVREFECFNRPINNLEFSENNEFLLFSTSHGNIVLYNFDSGQMLWSKKYIGHEIAKFYMDKYILISSHINADEDDFRSRDKTRIELFNLSNGKFKLTIYETPCEVVDFSPHSDGTLLAVLIRKDARVKKIEIKDLVNSKFLYATEVKIMDYKKISLDGFEAKLYLSCDYSILTQQYPLHLEVENVATNGLRLT